MSADVFICHTPLDQGVADGICEFLEGQGLKCWIAPRNLSSSAEETSEASMIALGACSALVLVFSRSANDSDLVQREAEAAVKAGKLMIPFRIEDVFPRKELEPLFQRRYIHDALTPPLERHLEELARLLRPLTFKRAVDNSDEALLSRTLPSRASVVRSSVGGQPISRESAGPVRISLNFDHVLIAGHTSTFEVVIENYGLENLSDMKITLESRSLRRAIISKWSSLPVDRSERMRLEIEPFRSEQSVLHVTAACRAGERQVTLTGSRSLIIHAVPTAEQLAQGAARLLDQGLQTSTFMTSAEPGIFAPTREKFGSLHELLNFKSLENFEPLDLALDHEVNVESLELLSRRAELHIPGGFLGRMAAGTKLILEPMKNSGAVPHQEIRLVARRSFHLGRSPDESDFLLWFWPRSELHDTKTRRISKKHCTLTSNGGKLFVANTAAASLTTFDGQDVTGTQNVLLDQRGILNVSGIYFLEVIRFSSSFPKGPAISNLPETHTGMKTDLLAGGDSVRFAPLTPHVLPQHSTWLLSDGTFGTSKANPILLDGVEEIQGRFYHHRGAFWLENLVANGAVKVDEQLVEPGSIIPLLTGQKIRLGEREFRATVSA